MISLVTFAIEHGDDLDAFTRFVEQAAPNMSVQDFDIAVDVNPQTEYDLSFNGETVTLIHTYTEEVKNDG